MFYMQNIKLHGSRNIRDIGGKVSSFRNETSGVPLTVRSGILFRGGHLKKITRKDARILHDEINLKLIIDLRTPDEVQQKPDKGVAGATHVHMPVYTNAQFGITHENWKTDTWEQLTARIPNMCELYPKALRGDSLEHMSEIIRTIVTHKPEDGALLYHCTEGKDRTGIISDILLRLLGVSEKDIYEDYVFTNAVSMKHAKKYTFLIMLLKNDRDAANRLEFIMSADPSFLKAAEDVMIGDWGSFEQFVAGGLKITDEEIAAFRKNYLI